MNIVIVKWNLSVKGERKKSKLENVFDKDSTVRTRVIIVCKSVIYMSVICDEKWVKHNYIRLIRLWSISNKSTEQTRSYHFIVIVNTFKAYSMVCEGSVLFEIKCVCDFIWA